MMTGTSGRAAFAFGSSSSPLMPGMLMSERIRISDARSASTMRCERCRRRLREIHHEAARRGGRGGTAGGTAVSTSGSSSTTRMSRVMRVPPDFASDAAPRGRTILNSVNSPGSVSTSIVPACCFTMMSWLSERPRPVPSPAGLVVKNGLNIFSFTSGGMPVPLSRMRISTLSPRFLVAADSVGS